MEKNEMLKTGTTTVGVIGKDCVILAADKRATAGNLIVDREVEKVLPVNKNMAITTAGMVSEIQLIVKYLKAEVNLKAIRSDRDVLVKEAANFIANMNYSGMRYRGSIAHFLFAGVDSIGNHLYDVYPDGSLTEISQNAGFIASGSGSVFALGVLEDSWKPGLTDNETVELAIRSISASMRRDSASGEGIDVYIIKKDGAKRESQKILKSKLE